ncbi:NAD-dependent epimerase/dehydratase family protein [Jatrophihabitans sp. YIM 134969]
MTIFLTGGSGYIGSAILNHLVERGREVRALARSDESAAAIERAGGTPVRGEITDTDLLAREAAASEGFVHTAATSTAADADHDAALLDAVLPALAGSGKPYLHTSGVWIHGNGQHITEESPLAPPELTTWRLPLDARVRAAAADGVRSVLIAPGIVYGHGGGIPNMVKSAPRADGALLYVGEEQHWTTVHVDDLARLYVLAFDKAAAGSYFLGVGGDNPLVQDLARAASHAAGLDGRVAPEPEDEARERLGAMYDALVLDQEATGDHARETLGWKPRARTLVDELVVGSYADLDG